ncbi:MAG: MFS transporter [Nocardioides sp.]
MLSAVHVLAAAAIVATCFVWFDAGAFGALPALVGRERVVAANSAVFAAATLAEVSFPAVAGLLIATVGPTLAIGADAASYLLAAVLLWRIPSRFQHEQLQGGARSTSRDLRVVTRRTASDIREGLVFLWHNNTVRALSLLGFGNSVTGGAVTGLIVVYAVQGLNLGTSDWRMGALFTASALGGFLASLFLPRLTRVMPIGWITIGSLTANPVLLIALAITPSLGIALPIYLLWAATWVLTIINGISTRQLATPDHLQSRVNTTARMIAWGGTPFGALLGGFVAETTSVRTAYVAMSAAVAASAVLAWISPLRRRDLTTDSLAPRQR